MRMWLLLAHRSGKMVACLIAAASKFENEVTEREIVDFKLGNWFLTMSSSAED